jgi:hypothetical protein
MISEGMDTSSWLASRRDPAMTSFTGTESLQISGVRQCLS